MSTNQPTDTIAVVQERKLSEEAMLAGLRILGLDSALTMDSDAGGFVIRRTGSPLDETQRTELRKLGWSCDNETVWRVNAARQP